MSDFMEFVGKTTEEALHKAQAHFDMPLNRLEVEVVSAGSNGLFGILGAKKAKVRVRPQAGPGLEAEMAELAAVVSENHRPAQPAPAAPAPAADRVQAPAPAPQPQQPSGVGETCVPPSAPAAPSRPEPSPVAETRLAAPPAPKPTPAAEPDETEDEEVAAADLELEEETPAQPDQRLEQDPQVLAHAQEALTRLVAPLDSTAQVTAVSGAQGIELTVQGQDVGVLIGRRGQNLEAMQYLVTRIVSHRCGRPVRIVVDAGEYRRRRRESLEDLARRMAQKARQTGKPVAMGPLAAQERRIVHLTLKGEPGLSTSSRGRGELKKVVIAPNRPVTPGGA